MSRKRSFDENKYYHVTTEYNVKSIFKYGLLPGKDIGKSLYEHVFLTKGCIISSKGYSYDGLRLRIFEVDPTGLEITDFSQYRNEPQYVVKYVPPENLKLLRKSRAKPTEEMVDDYEYGTYLSLKYTT